MNLKNLESLVRKAKLGDKPSLKEILNAFKPLILKLSNSTYIHSYTKDDLIQEGFCSLLKAIDHYDITKNTFVAYATNSIKNNYNYLIRQRVKLGYESSYNKKISIDNEYEIIDIIPSKKDIFKEFLKEENLKALKNAFKFLNIQQRDIIYQCYFMRLSMKEYALKNNMTYNQCKYIKATALAHLKQNLPID